MSESLVEITRRLTRVPGVRGAMVVDTETGLPVASELLADVPEVALAALTTSLLARTSDASLSGGVGAARVVQLDAEGGHILIAAAGALLVVALAGNEAQVGLVRANVIRAAKELAG